MLTKLVDQGTVPNLQLKVLSSVHYEKGFTLMINPKGIIPKQGEMLNNAGYEKGPRRQEFDGYTYFGLEDGVKSEEDNLDAGKETKMEDMNDFIITSNNTGLDVSKDQSYSNNPMMGDGQNH